MSFPQLEEDTGTGVIYNNGGGGSTPHAAVDDSIATAAIFEGTTSNNNNNSCIASLPLVDVLDTCKNILHQLEPAAVTRTSVDINSLQPSASHCHTDVDEDGYDDADNNNMELTLMHIGSVNNNSNITASSNNAAYTYTKL